MVNIIAVVNPSTKQVLLINTPRDYYVDTAASAGPKDKLTHCERSVYLFLLLLMQSSPQPVPTLSDEFRFRIRQIKIIPCFVFTIALASVFFVFKPSPKQRYGIRCTI